MAVRLFSELRKMTGRNLALSTLFQAPTIEKLAELLRNDGWAPSWSSLVPIQTKGDRPPFFCIHGAGGNVLMFHELARLMAPEHPFYGLQARGLDGSQSYLTSVEEMAVEYLKEIRQLQPEGPYYLGGFCMGGQVALEIAQILRKEGQQVAFLTMIDTYNFHGVPLRMSLSDQIQHAKDKIGFHWTNFARLSLKEEFGYLKKKFKDVCNREIEKMEVRISHWRKVSHHAETGGGQDLMLEQISEAAHFAYVATLYDGRVTIFKPQRNYAFVRDERMGWGDFVTDLEVIELPVDPGGIFVEPYVKTLAQELKLRIDAAFLSKPVPAPEEQPALDEATVEA